jgi:hypothetical protein
LKPPKKDKKAHKELTFKIQRKNQELKEEALMMMRIDIYNIYTCN